MFLKKLFLASASVLMLALAYHLGATSAGAQLSGTISAAAAVERGPYGGPIIYAVVGRTLYAGGDPGGGPAIGTPWSGGPIPGSSPVIAVGSSRSGPAPTVVLANGDTYAAIQGPGGPWSMIGNAVGSATGAATQSWGSVKVGAR